jgi:hypothetical protein
MRIRDGKNSDPRWKKAGSGINIPDPQNCIQLKLFPYKTVSYRTQYFETKSVRIASSVLLCSVRDRMVVMRMLIRHSRQKTSIIFANLYFQAVLFVGKYCYIEYIFDQKSLAAVFFSKLKILSMINYIKLAMFLTELKHT